MSILEQKKSDQNRRSFLNSIIYKKYKNKINKKKKKILPTVEGEVLTQHQLLICGRHNIFD